MICDICDGDPCPHPSFCRQCRIADRKLRRAREEAARMGGSIPNGMPGARRDELTGESLW